MALLVLKALLSHVTINNGRATSKRMPATHCFQGVRSKDGQGGSLVDGVPPRSMDVRLLNPGVDWNMLDLLKEKYILKFDDSLDEYLTKCFAKRNLRLRSVEAECISRLYAFFLSIFQSLQCQWKTPTVHSELDQDPWPCTSSTADWLR